MAFHSNYSHISSHFQGKTTKLLVDNRNFLIPPAFDASVGGSPRRHITITFGTEKLERHITSVSETIRKLPLIKA